MLIFILVCLIGRDALTQNNLVHLPGDFKDRAYHHVSNLASFGIRSAGTPGKQKQWPILAITVVSKTKSSPSSSCQMISFKSIK